MTEEQRERDIELAMLMLKEYNEVFPKSEIDLNEVRELLLIGTDQEFTKNFSIIFVLHNLAQEKLRAIELIENTYFDNEDNYIKNKFLGGLD